MHTDINLLSFKPLPGLSSPHAQTIFSILLNKGGKEPPSAPFYIPLSDGDSLYCMLSTPLSWTSSQKTILLIHGMGGSHAANYMVRMSRKFYEKGYRTLRINLRGIGPGAALAQRPYHGGSSDDILQVVQALKDQTPDTSIVLIGYSLGGNIALKLVGELGEKADSLLAQTIAICPPIDLSQTVQSLLNSTNRFYHRYYVKRLKKNGQPWIGNSSIKSIIDYDNAVTAPQWGFKDAFDYYRQSSSIHLLPQIRHDCHMIFSEDDPFVNYRAALKCSLFPSSKIWLSKQGGHVGFWGWAGREHGYFWLDSFLLQLIEAIAKPVLQLP